MMTAERLNPGLILRTSRAFAIRQIYHDNLSKALVTGQLEADLPFSGRDMYECWVAYSPYFFRAMKDVFDDLLSKGLSLEISQGLGNKFRILRYFSQLLLPGAFLDEDTPLEAKINFLNSFSQAARQTLQSNGYEDADTTFLYDPRVQTDDEKRAIGRLVSASSEACELIYFGEQPIGFPSYGLDTAVFPGNFTLYQDFDFNVNPKRRTDIPRISTVMVYPERSAPPFNIHMNINNAQPFLYRYWNTDNSKQENWFVGTPPPTDMLKGFVTIDGRKLGLMELKDLTKQVVSMIGQFSTMRSSQDQDENRVEYCLCQSDALIRLHHLVGENYRLDLGAKEDLASNTTLRHLKEEWGLDYSFEVSFELIRRSREWAKSLSSCSN